MSDGIIHLGNNKCYNEDYDLVQSENKFKLSLRVRKEHERVSDGGGMNGTDF